jgi:hypothetical protein
MQRLDVQALLEKFASLFHRQIDLSNVIRSPGELVSFPSRTAPDDGRNTLGPFLWTQFLKILLRELEDRQQERTVGT